MDILITQDNDIIYKLVLRDVINVPVQLFFTYTRITGGEEEGEGPRGVANVRNETSSITYNNSNTITHIEFRSMIPFQRFRVGVALMDGFTLGPINTSADEFGE